MIPVVEPSDMGSIDQYAIEKIGIPGAVLMERAALSVVDEIEKRFIRDTHILIVCGKGNNGGDGLAIGRNLKERGYSHLKMLLLTNPDSLKGDALLNFKINQNLNNDIFILPDGEKLVTFTKEADLIIDAIFGTGFSGIPTSPYKEAIEILNKHKKTIISVDIPSGLNGKTGDSHPDYTIKADYTITFQLPKIGFYLKNGPQYTGKIIIKDIGIPEIAQVSLNHFYYLLTPDITDFLPTRNRFSHKGENGKAGIWAGSKYLSGAPLFSISSCQLTGTGLIYYFTDKEILPFSYLFWDAVKIDIEKKNLPNLNSLLIGPGLGNFSSKKKEYFFKLVKTYASRPIIFDADGINFIASNFPSDREKTDFFSKLNAPLITPHPGEFSRLTNTPLNKLNDFNLLELIKEKGDTWQTNILFKSYYSFFYNYKTRKFFINTAGNESLAKGGSGDILSGLIAGFSSQIPLEEATLLSCFLLGKAAENYTIDHSSRTSSPQKIIEEIGNILDNLDG